MLTRRVVGKMKTIGMSYTRFYAFVTHYQIAPIKAPFVKVRNNNKCERTSVKCISFPATQADQSGRHFFTAFGLRQEVTAKTPAFGESITEGDVKFTCKVGDSFNADETVMEIETDKTTVPVPAPVTGTITAILVSDGASVKPGQELFKMIAGAVAAVKTAGTTAAPAAAPAAPPVVTPVAPKAVPKAAPSALKPAAASVAARLAAPAPVRTPPKAFVPPARAAPPPAKTPDKPVTDGAISGNERVGERKQIRVIMNPMRQQVVQNIKESKRLNAMLTTLNQIDMSTAFEFYEEKKEKFKIKYAVPLTLRSIFMKAVSNAILLQPVLNAYIDGKEIVYRDYIDIAISVATPMGIILPVIRDVESKNLIDIETALYMVERKAKKNANKVTDLTGATFTISNTGVVGAVMETPIMNLKQSAILAMHAISERPIAINGKVIIHPMMYVALTYDHRLIDGREAVLFLLKIKEGIEDMSQLTKGLY